jgi:hypothetical protein
MPEPNFKISFEEFKEMIYFYIRQLERRDYTDRDILELYERLQTFNK